MSLAHKSWHAKARLACCLVLGAVVLAPPAATAKPPGPPSATLDSVTATGSGEKYRDVNISAQSGPSGENPTGTGSFLVNPFSTYWFDIHGPVLCLAVTGNTAVVNIEDQGDVHFGVVTISLTDNGGNGLDRIDAANANRAPTDCSPFTGGVVSLLTDGRVVVVDVPPLRTTVEQCKHGGWVQFGFRNQGQCIKSVNHP